MLCGTFFIWVSEGTYVNNDASKVLILGEIRALVQIPTFKICNAPDITIPYGYASPSLFTNNKVSESYLSRTGEMFSSLVQENT